MARWARDYNRDCIGLGNNQGAGANMKALVLLSGGLDSSTTLAVALQECEWKVTDVQTVSFKYGSTHEAAESEAAARVARYYGLKRNTIKMYDLFKGDSALLGGQPIPDEEYHDPTKETPSATIVPFRNANFISAAVALAESQAFDLVYIGVHGTDARGWAYPDCSPEFIGAVAAAVYVGTLHKVRLVAPFLASTKADIVRKAHELNVPVDLTWSCYRGGSVHCGACPTCHERIAAFKMAGYVDPVRYQTGINWEGCTPWL